MKTNRRDILRTGAAGAAALLASPFLTWAQSAAATRPGKGKRVLLFTKSQFYPHSVVTRKKKADGTPSDELAWGEQLFHDWVTEAGYEVTVTKEGSYFTPENIAKFDTFAFYTCGDMTMPPGTQYDADKTSVMTAEGKAGFLKAIEEGKGFLSLHSGSDTFGTVANRQFPPRMMPKDAKADPYQMMLGAEFIGHGSQQQATLRVASRTFPGLEDLKEFTATEEWYAYTNLLPDLHVLLVQDTNTMKVTNGQREAQYRGEPYPQTWARMHGKGRVFSNSMGHREDIWTGPLFKKMLLAGLAWTTGVVNAEIKPNMAEACPKLWAAGGAATMPK